MFSIFRYLYIFYVYSIEESFLAPKSILMLLVVLFYKCWIKCIVCFSLSAIIMCGDDRCALFSTGNQNLLLSSLGKRIYKWR